MTKKRAYRKRGTVTKEDRKEQLRRSSREWYARNKERVKAKARAKYHADPETHKERIKRSKARVQRYLSELNNNTNGGET